MGSCVSLHKDPESALKLRIDFGSKTGKLVNPSPDKHKPVLVAPADAAVLKSHCLPSPAPPPVTAPRDSGSKEEAFFDSCAWLESDCDDDFFSVNGDFTPSRGNTPVHHSFSVGIPGANPRLLAAAPETSPTDKKKRLAELFKDSLQVEQEDVKKDGDPKSGNVTPDQLNLGSNERTANGDHSKESGAEKSEKSAQCCLPRLLSLSTERKKRTSPACSVGPVDEV